MASIDTSTGKIVTPPVPSVVTPTVAPPTASTVYSAGNLASASAGTTTVNPILDEYTQYMNSPELQAAKAKTAEIQSAINAEKAGLRSTTTGLEYQNQQALGTTGASMNLIGTQVGRASSLASDRISALGDQYSSALAYQQGLEQTAREKYNIIAEERSRVKSLIAQTGNQAGILATDTFEVATDKAYKWQKAQDKKAEKKAQEKADEEEKKNLKSLIAKLGGSTKNSKGGSLNLSKLRKEYERLTGEQYKKEQSRADQEWAMKVAAHNKSMASGDVKDVKAADAAFEKDAKAYAESVAKGDITREDAARFLKTYHPGYDENVIYDLIPDA